MSDEGKESTYYSYYCKTEIPEWIKWILLAGIFVAILVI